MPKRKRAVATPVEGEGALPFQEQELTFKLSLLPHAMEDIGAHVQAKLNALLMKYHDHAGGVLLALSKLRLPKERRFASVMGDFPFLHLHVQAIALVFAPRPGLALEGRVIKVARTHVALLVHGLFNAAIAKEEMGPGFTFHHPHDHGGSGEAYWHDTSAEVEGGEARMAVGDRVAFRLLRVHEAAGLIAMDGTLLQGPPPAEEEDKEAGASTANGKKAGEREKGEKKGKKKEKKRKKEKAREMAQHDLTGPPTKARASSVLNRNVREFGVARLFDGSHDSCWNSEQGSPQWVLLHFTRPVHPESIQLMFQGGFAGKEVEVSVVEASAPAPAPASGSEGDTSTATAATPPPQPLVKGKARAAAMFYPEDDNSLQSFDLHPHLSESERARGVTEMRLTFPSSTDFYGRVTLYQLKVLGREVAGKEGVKGLMDVW